MFTTVDITVCQYSESGKDKVRYSFSYINKLKTCYIHIHGAYLDSDVEQEGCLGEAVFPMLLHCPSHT